MALDNNDRILLDNRFFTIRDNTNHRQLTYQETIQYDKDLSHLSTSIRIHPKEWAAIYHKGPRGLEPRRRTYPLQRTSLRPTE
jgi:hypothetical protein